VSVGVNLKALAIIPCYNEEVSIGLTIRELKEKVPGIVIWVVDNDSTDATYRVAKKLGVRVLSCPVRGKGFAVRTAFSKIKNDFDVIFMVDGDHTYGIENIHEGFDLIVSGGYDMVVGHRVQVGDSQDVRSVHYRTGHVSGNRLFSVLFRVLFRTEISDTLSGWRVFSPGFVSSFSGGASGFELETELNAHLYLLRGSVATLPVSYRGRIEGSDSKLRTLPDGIKILTRLLFLFRTERPFFAYTLLGLPWFLLSAILISNVLKSYFESGLVPNFPSLIAGVGSFLVSILLWITGVLLSNQRILRRHIARISYSSGSYQIQREKRS